jgi:predicted dehydrogenase
VNTPLDRRRFLRQATLATAGAWAAAQFPALTAESPGRKLVAGVMGLGRGGAHIEALLALPNVEVAYVCDVDAQRLAAGARLAAGKQAKPPQAVTDFRRILDDQSVDLLTIAAPNHWHAPATILACAAGKHVYVEKPGSHNAREAELMVEAARKHQRVVQLGTQRRSWPGVQEMIERLRAGAIGRVLYSRCYYTNARGSIGRGQSVPVPPGLDYALWQGPAPDRPYVDNLVHYNWHWRWHWGGGELANNGVHALDLVRWGLGVGCPRQVTFNGGRYHFDDDQETPDTGAAVFDFGGQGAMWDNSSCLTRAQEKPPFVAFYGEGGGITQDGPGYTVYDLKGKETARGSGPGGDAIHFANFLAAIRDGARLNADIADGQKSALLCHLGNIAYRTGHTLHTDPTTGRIRNDKQAAKSWSREYRKGWEPAV